LINSLLYLSLNKISLKRAQVADEQLAVQVVGFMRHAPGLQIHHVQSERLAVDVLRLYNKPRRPRHVKEYPRKAKTPLLADLFAFFYLYHGIY
jgi:hypothetical protein